MRFSAFSIQKLWGRKTVSFGRKSHSLADEWGFGSERKTFGMEP
jgi:hypothetical protein